MTWGASQGNHSRYVPRKPQGETLRDGCIQWGRDENAYKAISLRSKDEKIFSLV